MQLLSVCVVHRNRDQVPTDRGILSIFPRCVDSLCASLLVCAQQAELVVCEWPPAPPNRPLAAWLSRDSTIPVKIIRETRPFSRGLGRNVAAANAQGDWLMFLDADMLLIPKVIRRGVELLRQGKAFFPLYDRLSPDGQKRTPGIGTGNCFCTREQWREAGGFCQKTEWGGEDTAFWRWFVERRLAVREPVEGFLHQWHPGGGPDHAG